MSTTELHFSVPDMDCQSCVRSITTAVQRLDPEATVEADLSSKLVRIHAAAPQDFGKAIEDAGFTVKAA